MTKILIEHNFHHPFNPEKVTGGTERYCYQLFTLLKQRGYDVTFVVPGDTEDRFLADDIIKLGRNSRQYDNDLGKCTNHSLWWAELDQLSLGYDLVVTATELSSRAFFKLKNLPPKQLHINHFAFLCQKSQMGLRYLLLCQYIREQGGKVLSSGTVPRLSAEAVWKEKRKVIVGSYYDVASLLKLDGDLHDGDIDVNILPYDLQSLIEVDEKRIIAVGRSEKGKRMPLAAKTLVELSRKGFDCEIYTTPYGNELEGVKEIIGGTEVKLNIGLAHAEIMKAFASTGMVLFASRDETNGIVAFEAASSGCTVFYSTPEPSHFLEPSNAGVKFEGNSPRKIAQLIDGMPYPTFSQRQATKEWFASQYSDDSVAEQILKWIV